MCWYKSRNVSSSRRGETRGLTGRRLCGAAVWLCGARGHRGGRVCSAESNVSPRYQNFFINEGTQTSERRGWGLGADEGAVCKHTSPPQRWLAVPDLTTCFLAAASHKSPAGPRAMWLTVIIVAFAEVISIPTLFFHKAARWLLPGSGGGIREGHQDWDRTGG